MVASAFDLAVEQEMPGLELEREFGFTLGRLSLGLLRGLAGLAGEDLDEETREILQGLRRAEVASYVVVRPPDADRQPRLEGLERRYARQGWEKTLSAAQEGELVWVLCLSGDRGELRGLLAIVLDGDELTVVRLEGDLDAALETIAADAPDEFVEAFLPSS